ncbi:hypothetical protein [Nocardiopsis sp. MG754419]|uniref:hypothetical protein n=1 Tax=Nocardiopsis sp. MG754419 TaxID=2259865 RepID=UPI0020122A2A|nr:hypothetical protein [Nocardiopsis sp. MG754419]
MRYRHFDELDSNNERYAYFKGQGFTGYAVESEPGYVSHRAFIRGVAQGCDYTINESGTLADFAILAPYRPIVGAVIGWDEDGHLTSEKISDEVGRLLIHREWDSRGNLHLELSSELSKMNRFLDQADHHRSPWLDIPQAAALSDVTPENCTSTVRVADLQQESDGGLFYLRGQPFTGDVLFRSLVGAIEVRAVVDGREEGPVFRWSLSGNLIIQGVRRHPHGPVGPWHEWDEQGRLLRETIYDALGNKIIHRELDENQNIVEQEHFAPTTLMIDPETGEQYPAPWL